MAINTEEFVNPKSMATPGFLAAAVASVAGAVFSMFGIALPAALIILSFFFGAVVFHSKEFADPQMKKWTKWFFYILNSLIIFAMATGTHSVLDKRGRTSVADTRILSFSAAYAAEAQPDIPLLKQERPIFYDWTSITRHPSERIDEKSILKYTAEKDFGTVKGVFVAAGLATPDYKVRIEVDKSKLPDEVKSVTWKLPAAYFTKDRVAVSDESNNFAVRIDAWKPFAIGAKIELKSGEILQLEEFISFDVKKK